METFHYQEAIERMEGYLSKKGRSELTIKSYKADIGMFFAEMGIDSFSVDELELLAARWLNKFKRTIAPKTTGRRLTTMRNLGRAFRIEILVDYSAPTPARAMPHPLPQVIDDVVRMLDAAKSPVQRALITLTGLCGCRVGEARNVKFSDIDVQQKMLTIYGKGGRVRRVPISSMAWSYISNLVLEAHLSGATDELIVAFSDKHARNLITAIAARAGVTRPVSSHDLRASYATGAYNTSKGNIRVVQELLGHANVEQTTLYTGVTLSAMRTAIEFQ